MAPEIKRLAITTLAETLQSYEFRKPVVDKTGLDGRWDFR
jgi:uncharacterized protein (TIGR03435 family)